jgi:hypothetical protein
MRGGELSNGGDDMAMRGKCAPLMTPAMVPTIMRAMSFLSAYLKGVKGWGRASRGRHARGHKCLWTARAGGLARVVGEERRGGQ